MRLLRESVLVLALGLSLSSTAAPSETSFIVKRGAYPWHVWNSPVYKDNFTWPEFRKKVAELNGLQNNDKAFRHLKRGTELKVPAPLGVEASPNEVARIRADQQAQDKQAFAEVEKGLRSEIKRLEDAVSSTSVSVFRNGFFWLCVGLAFVVGGTIVYILLRHRRDYEAPELLESPRLRKLEAEVTHLRHWKRESEVRDYFLDQYTLPFVVPDELGKVLGKTHTIYLQRAEPIDGEPAVLVYGEQRPVKLKNLKKHLYNASDETLRFYKIEKGYVESTDTAPTTAL
jgi:hypothetical protein